MRSVVITTFAAFVLALFGCTKDYEMTARYQGLITHRTSTQEAMEIIESALESSGYTIAWFNMVGGIIQAESPPQGGLRGVLEFRISERSIEVRKRWFRTGTEYKWSGSSRLYVPGGSAIYEPPSGYTQEVFIPVSTIISPRDDLVLNSIAARLGQLVYLAEPLPTEADGFISSMKTAGFDLKLDREICIESRVPLDEARRYVHEAFSDAGYVALRPRGVDGLVVTIWRQESLACATRLVGQLADDMVWIWLELERGPGLDDFVVTGYPRTSSDSLMVTNLALRLGAAGWIPCER